MEFIGLFVDSSGREYNIFFKKGTVFETQSKTGTIKDTKRERFVTEEGFECHKINDDTFEILEIGEIVKRK